MNTTAPVGFIHTDRDRRIATLYREGLLAAEIATLYDLTPGRIHQILRAQGLHGSDGGRAVQRRARKALLAQLLQETA